MDSWLITLHYDYRCAVCRRKYRSRVRVALRSLGTPRRSRLERLSLLRPVENIISPSNQTKSASLSSRTRREDRRIKTQLDLHRIDTHQLIHPSIQTIVIIIITLASTSPAKALHSKRNSSSHRFFSISIIVALCFPLCRFLFFIVYTLFLELFFFSVACSRALFLTLVSNLIFNHHPLPILSSIHRLAPFGSTLAFEFSTPASASPSRASIHLTHHWHLYIIHTLNSIHSLVFLVHRAFRPSQLLHLITLVSSSFSGALAPNTHAHYAHHLGPHLEFQIYHVHSRPLCKRIQSSHVHFNYHGLSSGLSCQLGSVGRSVRCINYHHHHSILST